MRLLVTGVAGFIGFHLAKLRLARGDWIVGIDNLNDYYDPRLKLARLEQLQVYPNFHFYQADITDQLMVNKIFNRCQPQRVINLAAQVGVRSLIHPQAYVQTNVAGFTNIIEACRHQEVEHLVYASTSAVYGANRSLPYKEKDNTNHPLAIYAATKKANELIAHSYAHLYTLPSTGLRFFTVYGPWGRPDMAFFSFTRNILSGRAIKLYNKGQMRRDFTYIDDIVAAVSLVIDKPASANPYWSAFEPDAASSSAPYRIYNIGCGESVDLMDYIETIEQVLGKKAIKEFLPMQKEDMLATHANTQCLHNEFGYLPKTNYQEGIKHFINWYLRDYLPYQAK